jgi:hypothetical protein
VTKNVVYSDYTAALTWAEDFLDKNGWGEKEIDHFISNIRERLKLWPLNVPKGNMVATLLLFDCLEYLNIDPSSRYYREVELRKKIEEFLNAPKDKPHKSNRGKF